MLSIATKCQLIFLSSLLLLSVVTTAILPGKTDGLQSQTLVSPNRPTKVVEPLITTQLSFTTTVVITPTVVSHKLNGVGVHLFDADNDPTDTQFEDALDTLGLKYLRIQFGPNWDHENIPDPPACNDDSHRPLMYDFVQTNFNSDYSTRLDNAKTVSGIAEAQNIEIIYLNWRAFEIWLTDPIIYRELKEEYVNDYACFVTQVVKYLTDNEVKISYLEPTNEPDGTTDTKIPPGHYNNFVKFLREYLDEEGLDYIKILGPGLAYLNHDNTCESYVGALDPIGVNAIGVWAFHAWDPEFSPNEQEEDILRMRWQECQEIIKGIDPLKPIFITEYACVNVEAGDPTKVNALCAVKNTLTLLDAGANVAVYWYLKEQSWDPNWKNWERALLEEDYDKKATFIALTSILPFISGDEVGVLETQVEGRITAASFYNEDNESGREQIVVSLANSYPESENVLIYFEGGGVIDNIADRVLYDGETNAIQEPGPVLCQAAQCQLSLPPNTVTTLIFRWTLYLPIIIKHN